MRSKIVDRDNHLRLHRPRRCALEKGLHDPQLRLAPYDLRHARSVGRKALRIQAVQLWSIFMPDGVSTYQPAPKSCRPSPFVWPRLLSPEKK